MSGNNNSIIQRICRVFYPNSGKRAVYRVKNAYETIDKTTGKITKKWELVLVYE
jgi:hypothetical protein